MPDLSAPPIPTLWLLGKTGAGKSSILHALTGLSHVEIGNGFQPCTRSAVALDFPSEAPLMRFMDTRGLGEASYDPTEDLAALEGRSHMVVLVARLDDPAQDIIAKALRAALKRKPMKVLLAITAADTAADAGSLSRAAAALTRIFENAAGGPLPQVMLSQENGLYTADSLEALRAALAELLPEVAVILAENEASGAEHDAFLNIRARVLFYAGIAGATDVMPAVGALSVPAAQTAMLREIGGHYSATWSKPLLWRFLGTLGTGIAARYAALFGLRQLGKLIPVYGQTVVAAASGTVSFATTYALGRAAAYFLYHHTRGEKPDPDELRRLYKSALASRSRT